MSLNAEFELNLKYCVHWLAAHIPKCVLLSPNKHRVSPRPVPNCTAPAGISNIPNANVPDGLVCALIATTQKKSTLRGVNVREPLVFFSTCIHVFPSGISIRSQGPKVSVTYCILHICCFCSPGKGWPDSRQASARGKGCGGVAAGPGQPVGRRWWESRSSGKRAPTTVNGLMTQWHIAKKGEAGHNPANDQQQKKKLKCVQNLQNVWQMHPLKNPLWKIRPQAYILGSWWILREVILGVHFLGSLHEI